MGRTIHSQRAGGERHVLELSGLASGVYLLELESASYRASERLVVE